MNVATTSFCACNCSLVVPLFDLFPKRLANERVHSLKLLRRRLYTVVSAEFSFNIELYTLAQYDDTLSMLPRLVTKLRAPSNSAS